ncbi:hypothetical protein TNCV_1957731 [Trichonephila clavipes]|nr:hypothetical protein TNCV_1957731 [Trichonephila clavipes]
MPQNDGLEVGQSHATCCRDFRISRKVVSTLWIQFKETGIGLRRPGKSRKRAETLAQDHYLNLLASRKGLRWQQNCL